MGVCSSREVSQARSKPTNKFIFTKRKRETQDVNFRPEQAPTTTAVKKSRTRSRKKESKNKNFAPMWLRRRSYDSAADLGASISNTFRELTREDPAAMEENAIRRAMELSMLDCAIIQTANTSGDHLPNADKYRKLVVRRTSLDAGHKRFKFRN